MPLRHQSPAVTQTGVAQDGTVPVIGSERKEAPLGFEPGMADLQSATPRPQGAVRPKTSGDPAAPLTGPLTGTADNACALLRETDPDLARVIDAWPSLPEAIKRAVLALVQSS